VSFTLRTIYLLDKFPWYPLDSRLGELQIRSESGGEEIESHEDKTQSIYFYRRHGQVEAHLTFKGRNIPFVKDVKYLGAICYRKITWRSHTDWIVTKALRTFIRIYSIL